MEYWLKCIDRCPDKPAEAYSKAIWMPYIYKSYANPPADDNPSETEAHANNADAPPNNACFGNALEDNAVAY